MMTGRFLQPWRASSTDGSWAKAQGADSQANADGVGNRVTVKGDTSAAFAGPGDDNTATATVMGSSCSIHEQQRRADARGCLRLAR